MVFHRNNFSVLSVLSIVLLTLCIYNESVSAVETVSECNLISAFKNTTFSIHLESTRIGIKIFQNHENAGSETTTVNGAFDSGIVMKAADIIRCKNLPVNIKKYLC